MTVRKRLVTPALVLLAALAVTEAGSLAQQANAETHRTWMNDASDAQEDFRFAVAEKDPNAAAAALEKIEQLMANTEQYWTQRKAADGTKLARDSRTHAQQGAAAAKGGDLPKAGNAFEAMSASCNACHELHLEKR